MQDRYWTLETGGGIQAVADKKYMIHYNFRKNYIYHIIANLLIINIYIYRSSNALFELAWQGDGSVCFRANNGKYVFTKRSGHLYANVDAIDDACKYFFYLINRYLIIYIYFFITNIKCH